MERTIGIDARTIFTTELTGIGTYVLKLIRSLQNNGVRLTLFTTTAAEAPSDLDLSQITVACAPGRQKIWEARVLPRLLKEHPVDLYHATQNFGIPKLACPTVLTLYDIIPLVLKGFYTNTFASKVEHVLYRHLVRQSVRRADMVITISEASKRDIIGYFPEARLKTVSIPLAADDPPDVATLPKLPELQNGPYLLYFGGFELRKNVKLILSTFSDIRKRFPEVRLVMVGKKNQYFRDHLKCYENVPGIIFTDYLDRPSLDSLTARATAVLYPSRYEGFGLPILEAMRFGTPVVTSNVSALPEVAHDAAELIDPDSRGQYIAAVTKILGDPSYRNELAQRGKQRASEYTWEKTFNTTWGVYQQLLEQHDHGQR